MQSTAQTQDAETNTAKYYPAPSVTVDAIVTKPSAEGGHQILLITRGRDPF